MSEIKLAYWNVRGTAEPIVLMLEFLKIKYSYKQYTDGNEWFGKDKMSLNMDFVNLPYLVDGDLLMSESLAIMRFIGRKFKALYPQNDEEERKCDVAQGAVLDLRNDFTNICYNKDFDNLKENYVTQLPNKLSKFEKVLSKQSWLTGEKLMYVDFVFGEILSWIELFSPGVLGQTPAVKKFVERFEALDQIAAYKSSDRFRNLPIMGPFAQWGNKAE